MKVDISLSSISHKIRKFLKRFHLILFVLLAIGGLAVAVFFINRILVTSSQAAESSLSESTSVDQQTIDAINSFHTSTSSEVPTFERPAGRESPFSE